MSDRRVLGTPELDGKSGARALKRLVTFRKASVLAPARCKCTVTVASTVSNAFRNGFA